MTLSNARRYAPMMGMLLLLTVTATGAGADGRRILRQSGPCDENHSDYEPAKRFDHGLLSLDLSAVSEAATATVNRSSFEQLAFGFPDRTAFEAAIALDAAPLAGQSPPHATAASNDVPESDDSDLNRIGLFIGATTKTNGIPPLPLSQARLHAWLGEQDEALDMVQIAIEQNDFGLLFLAVDPRLDPLREHPRFVSLSKAWNERERDP